MTAIQQPWTVDRKSGVLVIANSFEDIQNLFNGFSRTENNNRDCDFMFAVVGSEFSRIPIDRDVMEPFFRGLWKDFNILNSLVVLTNCGGTITTENTDVRVGHFNPFEYRDGTTWGRFHWLSRSNVSGKMLETDSNIRDFHGYPLQINQFIRYPTAIPRSLIPVPVQESYIYKHCRQDGKKNSD